MKPENVDIQDIVVIEGNIWGVGDDNKMYQWLFAEEEWWSLKGLMEK